MSEVTRREVLRTALAVGFALAVQPVAADTIHTDEVGLTAGEVQIPTSDGHIPAYRAMPAGKKHLPVILVVQEIFGVHEHIKDVCRRFAKRGYLAVAPELFVRQGDVSQITDISQIVSQVVSKVPDAQVMSDLDATAAWATGREGGDAGRLGCTGFCWGGRIVWLYAAHNPHLRAAAAWYGPLVGNKDALHPLYPVDITASLKAPVLGQYGGLDGGIRPEHVAQMRSALEAAHSPSTIIVYPDAGHGFHADYRLSYNAKDAAEGDTRMYDWFKKYGVV